LKGHEITGPSGRYFRTIVGSKFLCVVVKTLDDDAFVLTAYLTDRIKRGVALWPTPNAE
jgi:hypothetical protein